jgi:hypothetical protein
MAPAGKLICISISVRMGNLTDDVVYSSRRASWISALFTSR